MQYQPTAVTKLPKNKYDQNEPIIQSRPAAKAPSDPNKRSQLPVQWPDTHEPNLG